MKVFVKIWKDPVVSKIIASLIMLVLTAIGGAISEKWTMDGVLSVLQIPVPLWILLIAYFLYLFMSFFFSKNRKPSFLEYKSENNIRGYDWVWSWERNINRKYQIFNIHPLCSKCKTPLKTRSIYSNNYICSNGHSVSCDKIEFGLAASDIEDRIIKKYPKDTLRYFSFIDFTDFNE